MLGAAVAAILRGGLVWLFLEITLELASGPEGWFGGVRLPDPFVSVLVCVAISLGVTVA